MPNAVQYAGQAAFFIIAAAVTGYFSALPAYRQFPEGMAQVKLSFSHGAHRIEACRRLTSEEIAALPANERRPNNCSRERNDVRVEFLIDGKLLYSATLPPAGLSRDGPSRAYRKFAVPAGNRMIVARLDDTGRSEGFGYETERQVELVAGQSLSVDFRADQGGFVFK